MKCPVCGNVNTSMVCLKCGFDSSRNYGKYPTLGPVGEVTSVSSLRAQWQEKQKTMEPVPTELQSPAEPVKTAGRLPNWLVAVVCVVVLALGIGIGFGLGGGKIDPSEKAPAPERWRNNILRSDEIVDQDGNHYLPYDEFFVFGSDYLREQIRSVTFLDTLAEQPDDAWDVSAAGNGSVMAWVKPKGTQYDLYIGAEGGVSAGESCKDLFWGYENAASIRFGDAFHTENVQDMSWMFFGCRSLTELTLGDRFDTSNVQDMSYMFCHCRSLTELTLGDRFDTSNVQDMSSMFYYCRSLKELTLGDGFDTSNVKRMDGMFSDCSSLTELTLGDNFDTSHVQNMSWMFYDCSSLKKLTLGDRFDTSNVLDMSYMFSICSSLTELTLGDRFDTSNVLDMSYMFSICGSLTELTLGDSFVTTNAITTDMFDMCPAGDEWGHLVN